MKQKKQKGGYTIIETMIAISVFLVVVLYGMNSLLSANEYSRRSENTRSLMDSLSFAIEDMSRSLRTGSEYHCITDGNTSATVALSCPTGGQGVSFISSTRGQWVYYLAPDSNGDGYYYLEKSTAGGISGSFVPFTTSEIKLDPSSSISVVGAEPPPGDQNQPLIKIWLKGIISYEGTDTPFSLQTSVSQRIVDVTTN